MTSPFEVKELRSGDRFLVAEPLVGTFGAAEVTIVNVAEQGVQIAHAQPIRVAARARLWFKRGSAAASVHGFVVWSHLAPSAHGDQRYLSGIRIDERVDEFAGAIQSLADQGVLRRDHDSLARKRQRAAEREQERIDRPRVKYIHHEPDVPADQALLVRHALERLRLDPDEARKWYNRARFATAEDGAPIASEHLPNREEVLAVWEYLERTVPVSAIVRVFAKP